MFQYSNIIQTNPIPTVLFVFPTPFVGYLPDIH